MGKFNKILLGGLICATSFAFITKVSATAAVEYPTYHTDDIVMYDSTNGKNCDSLYGNCMTYRVIKDLSLIHISEKTRKEERSYEVL